jgi:hypothetical protein
MRLESFREGLAQMRSAKEVTISVLVAEVVVEYNGGWRGTV